MQVDDDDYSQSSNQSDTSSIDLEESTVPTLNPLDSAIEDLEGRIISSLDNFKLHPGIKSNPASETIHSELKSVLRPVLEIAAHIGPATARSTWRSAFRPSLDIAMEEVHTKLNADLIFPVLLESAQSDVIPAKRAASLMFFHNLHQEYKLPGSYLDYIEGGGSGAGAAAGGGVGRYAGSLYNSFEKTKHAPPSRMILKQRTAQKAQKMALLLRYWIVGATACTVEGAFTDRKSDGAIASRAVISSSAVIRPALRAVAEKISSADDTGALKLFIPVMRMIGGVLKRFFAVVNVGMGDHLGKGEMASVEALKSACVKFLEIVVLSFSSRVQPGGNASSRRRQNVSTEDFALEDLPVGHPIITRHALEEIGEDAFTVLRGLSMIGGQVKVESGMISDVRLSLGLDAQGTFVVGVGVDAKPNPFSIYSNYHYHG
jgi:symplekin